MIGAAIGPRSGTPDGVAFLSIGTDITLLAKWALDLREAVLA